MLRRFIGYAICVAVVFFSSSVWAQDNEPSSLQQLIEQMRNKSSWDQTVSMKMAVDTVFMNDSKKAGTNTGHLVQQFTYRRDHDRVEWKGTENSVSESQTPVAGSIYDYSDIFTSGFSFHASNHPAEANPDASIERKNIDPKPLLIHPERGRFLEGAMYGSKGRDVADLLLQSEKLTAVESEEVGGVTCRVVEGHGPFGTVRAWVAPSYGNALVKYRITKAGPDLFEDQAIASSTMASWVYEVGPIHMVKIGDQYVADSGEMVLTIHFVDGHTTQDVGRCVRSDIDLDPDFTALNAFTIEVPEGTLIHDSSVPGISYQWRQGKIVPLVDSDVLNSINTLMDSVPTSSDHDVHGTVARISRESSHEIQEVQKVPRTSFWWVAAVASGLASLVVVLSHFGRRLPKSGSRL